MNATVHDIVAQLPRKRATSAGSPSKQSALKDVTDFMLSIGRRVTTAGIGSPSSGCPPPTCCWHSAHHTCGDASHPAVGACPFWLIESNTPL